MKTNPSDPHKVQLKSKISVCDGYLRVDRYRVTHQLYGGGWSQVLEREVMSRGAVTGVLLFDPDATGSCTGRAIPHGRLGRGLA